MLVMSCYVAIIIRNRSSADYSGIVGGSSRVQFDESIFGGEGC